MSVWIIVRQEIARFVDGEFGTQYVLCMSGPHGSAPPRPCFLTRHAAESYCQTHGLLASEPMEVEVREELPT